ncbi:methyltransferase domain-containing protein [Saccharopolyspora rhizosphaerae]|uniref:Methyltransferase domain-containing protein n=1 Tax=Saccharopolyspora rhizosphaerae TaxID=2492662 RepID=A0A426JJ35_9PSEU|nr:methyltransferase domain-containing protein [Saccharopolyspora rhizosphaerae]RRO13175.1 methyltransferase domain-containing protein [Saccharopolyspora rhizosphaerae]
MGAQDTYTHGHHESVLRSHRWRTAENSAGYLLGDLRPGVQVLDVGCGPGTITLDFAERVAPGRVLGIDNVEDPLEISRAGAAERGLDNVEFEVADVYRLPYADDSFDVVHAHQVLQHLTDPVAALREMRRVCRPSGVVAARDADYGGMRWSPDNPGLDRWLELYRSVARRNDAEPDAGKHLKTWALQAGFTNVECTASAWCFATPEERTWWGDLWADRIRRSAFATQATGYGLTTEDELETLAEAWHAWRDTEQGWFGVLNSEIRCHP